MIAEVTVHIDCRKLSRTYFDWVRKTAPGLGYTPGIATVCRKNGADPGSLQYRDFIIHDAQGLGFRAVSVEAADEAELRAALNTLNRDPSIHGIVVLYPLRFDLPDTEIMDLIDPEKDIEGLHSLNLGYLIKYRKFLNVQTGVKCVVPATAKSVVKVLQHYQPDKITGAFAVIVNNSLRVGNPLGLMLENLGATVVKCYDKTSADALEYCVRKADIVVTAVPDSTFRIKAAWIKPEASVIDVSFRGNFDPGALEGKASLMSVPGSLLGRMTRAMMFVNLMYCCEPRAEAAQPTT